MEDEQFRSELAWCIDELEKKLSTFDPYCRPAQTAVKIHRILTSVKSPLIKKRQAMQNMFGDYRAKMKTAEKKHLSSSKPHIVAVKELPKESRFIRKSNKMENKCSGERSAPSSISVTQQMDPPATSKTLKNTAAMSHQSDPSAERNVDVSPETDPLNEKPHVCPDEHRSRNIGVDGNQSDWSVHQMVSSNKCALQESKGEFQFRFSETDSIKR